MKECGKVRELLSPYLEDELEPDESGRVKGHLDGCAECRADLELLKMTVGALRELPELPAPAGILRGVREGLEPRPWYERLRSRLFPAPFRQVPLGALASVLVAFGIFLIYDRFPEVGEGPVIAPPAEEVRAVPEKKDTPVFLDEAKPRSAPLPEASVETAPPRSPEGNETPPAAGTVGFAGKAAGEAEEGALSGARPGPAVPPPAELRDMPAPAGKKREAAPVRRTLAVEEQPPPGPVAPPSVPPFPGPPPAPEPVAPPAMEIPPGRKNVEEAKREEAPEAQPAGAAMRQDAEKPYDFYRSDRDGAASSRSFKKKAAGAAPSERAAAFAEPESRLQSKALPPPAGADDAVVGMLESVTSLRESSSALPETGRGRAGVDVTEVLTVVSLDGGEVGQLRERLRKAGGRMLEMRTLDAFASQQLALPHQQRIPPTQAISQGWQIRAAVPRSSVEDFVASLEGESSLQLLHRTTEPLTWSQERGLQNFEINLIR